MFGSHGPPQQDNPSQLHSLKVLVVNHNNRSKVNGDLVFKLSYKKTSNLITTVETKSAKFRGRGYHDNRTKTFEHCSRTMVSERQVVSTTIDLRRLY